MISDKRLEQCKENVRIKVEYGWSLLSAIVSTPATWEHYNGKTLVDFLLDYYNVEIPTGYKLKDNCMGSWIIVYDN